MADMMVGIYHSTFCAENADNINKLAAWAIAYKTYLAEAPNRPGWCQKKADDDWRSFIAHTLKA